MNKHISQQSVQPMRQNADPVARRAFIQDWIARNQRRMAAGLGMLTLALPMLAEAKGPGMIEALGVSGVRAAELNADGSVTLTLANGQKVTVTAANVQVAPDGVILISNAAAQQVLEIGEALSVSASMVTGEGGAAVDGALVAAGLGGLALAGLALGSGSSGGGASAPAPVPLNAAVLSANGLNVNVPALFSGFPELEDGDEVFLSFNPEVRATIDPETGYATFAEPLDLAAVQSATELSVRVERGDETIFEGSTSIIVDTIAPVVNIDTPIAGDGVLNAAESGADLVITGTAEGAEDGQIVTVTFNGVDFTTTVAGKAWTLTITAQDLASLNLTDGAEIEITANVEDQAGNPADTASATLTTDFTASIVLDPVTIETLNTFIGVEISGTTEGVEDGREVSVTFAGQTFTGAVADNAFTIPVPASVVEDLADGTPLTIGASVSDAAGNPASASVTSTPDFSAPALVITAPDTGGFINEVLAGQPLEVRGNGLPDTEVTVTLQGAEPLVVIVGEDASWRVTFEPDDLPTDQGPFNITASGTLPDGTVLPPFDISLTLDTIAPEVTLDITVGATDVIVSGTANNGATEVTLDLGGPEIIVPVTGGTFTRALTAEDLPSFNPGDVLAISASARDAAGNISDLVTANLTTPTLTLDAPEAGFTLDLTAFEDGFTVSGSTTDVAAGSTVTVTLAETGNAPDVTLTGTVGADGSWSVTVPSASIAALPSESALTLNASVASGPFTASAMRAGSADIVPELTVDPIGEDGVFFLGDDQPETLTLSGSTRGVQEGQLVRITNQDGELIATAAVQANGSWTVDVAAPDDLAPGQTISASFTVDTASGRAAAPVTGTLTGYLSSVFLAEATGVTSEGIVEFDVKSDLSSLPNNRFRAFRFELIYDPEEISLVPAELVEIDDDGTLVAAGGLHPQIAIGERAPNEDANGEVLVFGLSLIGQFTEASFTSDPIYRFEIDPQVDNTPIVLTMRAIEVDGVRVGSSTTVIGTNAVDDLVAGSVDTTIRGRGGNDQIDVSAVGVHTVIFEPGSNANGFDTVTGFTLSGALADRFAIAFDTGIPQGSLRGAGTDFQLADGGAIGANVGLLVFTTAVADFDTATLETALAGAGFTGLADGDGFFLLVGDGTNAQLTFAEQSGGALVISTSSTTAYAQFNEIGDLAGFGQQNILGFNELS